MDPRSFLQFAKMLATSTRPGPAECRSAISRSYYSAYLVAVSFLKDHARLEPRGGADKHSAVKLSFMECKDADAKRIGVRLDTLHTQRKDADYEMSKPGPETQAAALAASRLSEELIDELGAMVKSTKRAAVVAEIKAWATSPAGSTRLRNS